MTEYQFVVSLFLTKPISLSLIKNCKYTELAFQFRSSTSGYTFIYFIQDNKSNDLSYFGLINSTSQNDPSFTSTVESYSPSEFATMFGYEPAFTASSVKNISIRQSSVFKRKSLTVSTTQEKVNKYYMYYSLINASPQKLYSCGCKGSSGSS
jgi:hypothetical protein